MAGSYERTLTIRRRQSQNMKRYYKAHPTAAVDKAPRGPSHQCWKGGPKWRNCTNCGTPTLVARHRLHKRNRFCGRRCSNTWSANHRSAITREKLSIAATMRSLDPQSRFGNPRTITHYHKGILSQSGYEDWFLDLCLKAGFLVLRNRERFPYRWSGHPHMYTPDFIVWVGNRWVYVEIKGWVRKKDYVKIESVKKEGEEIYMLNGSDLKSMSRLTEGGKDVNSVEGDWGRE